MNLPFQNVGFPGGSAYFCPENADLKEARCYVDLMNSAEQWKTLIKSENIDSFEECQLLCTAVGRAMLFLDAVEKINGKLTELMLNGKISEKFKAMLPNCK